MKFQLFDWTRLPAICRQAPKVVIAYEDAETFHRVKEALNGFFGGDAAAHQAKTAAWKFDLFNDLRLERLAVEDAVAADLIVISAHGHSDLPAGVKNWIDHWLDNKTTDGGVLVALLDGASQDERPAAQILHYLSAVAASAHFDWFAAFCEPRNGYTFR
jgi:hypothetical protein